MTRRQPKTNQDWQKVRRKNPRLFYSSEAQKLMLEDASALGNEEFFKHVPTEEDL